jgi:hypothetical protein
MSQEVFMYKRYITFMVALIFILAIGACTHENYRYTKDLAGSDVSGGGGGGGGDGEGGGSGGGKTPGGGGNEGGETAPGKFMRLTSITSSTVGEANGDYEDVFEFYYVDDQLADLTRTKTKAYDKPPLIPPLVREEYAYDDNGVLKSIVRKRGMSVNDMQNAGTSSFVYDEDGRLESSLNNWIFKDSSALNFKWMFNNTDDGMTGTLQTSVADSQAQVSYNEAGLPLSVKMTGTVPAEYVFTYGDKGLDKIKKTVQAGSYYFTVYRDLDGKITHATYEQPEWCSIIEVKKRNDAGLITKEEVSVVQGGCLGWETNSKRKVTRERVYEYEEVNKEPAMPPTFIMRIIPKFTLRQFDDPAGLFGKFMYFSTVEGNANDPIETFVSQ